MADYFSTLSLAQWIATILSLVYIFYAVKNKSIAFAFGLFASAIWAYEDFANLNLKFDGVLQLFYVGMSIYGIYSWKYGGMDGKEKPIIKLSKTQSIGFFLLGLVVSIIWGYIGSQFFNTRLPYLDALTTGFSIIATYLLVKRYIDNWIYWILINPIYMLIYWKTGAVLFVGIMLVYTLMAILGFRNWRKAIDIPNPKFWIMIPMVLIVFMILPSGEKQVEASDFPPYSGESISYLLIDGMDQNRFRKLLDQDHLPNMQRLKKEGLYVENGIGSFPSMTGYAFYPFITGQDACDSGVLGLRWFDRSKENGQFRNYVGRSNIHMNGDLNDRYKTLYERFDSFYTCSVNSYMTKGVKDEVKTGWALTTSKYQDVWLFKLIKQIPYFGKQWTYSFNEHESNVAKIAISQLDHNPPVQWLTFACPDAYAHIYGMDDEYDKILIHIDSLIGEMVHRSQELGQARNFAIITDHGLENVNKNIHVCKIVEEDIGLKLKRGDSTNLIFSSLDDDASQEELDGYFVINGNLAAYVYLNAEGYSKKLSASELSNFQSIKGEKINLLDYFSKQDYLDMIMYQVDQNTIAIQDSKGIAHIHKEEKAYRYEILSSDVFDYSSDSFDLSIPYSTFEWAELTAESQYPLAVPRSFDLVSNEASGDLVLCSAKEIDLAKDYEILVGNYKGGHGGLRSSMLRVPYILWGPKITSKEVYTCRSEDFGATVFDLLGMYDSTEMKGKTLLTAIDSIK